MSKTAILLYGYMRTYKTTSASFLDKVARPNDADVFVFTYSNEGVSKLDPNLDIRIFSLYYNINEAIKLLSKYEKTHNIRYEKVLITRPDLLFYSEIDFNSLDPDLVYVPSYGGNIAPPLKSLINTSVAFIRM